MSRSETWFFNREIHSLTVPLRIDAEAARVSKRARYIKWSRHELALADTRRAATFNRGPQLNYSPFLPRNTTRSTTRLE
jgi:hypothetical protein